MVKIEFIETEIKGAYEIKLSKCEDQRGFFSRLYCADEMKKAGITKTIEQANYSFTKKKGTVRGLHYQLPPKAENKLIRCVQGEIFDVVIDLRKGSPTHLKWYGVKLSRVNMKMLLVPEGCAHGFQALKDNSAIIYLVTAQYSKEYERGLNPQDPLIGIKWPLTITELSERDREQGYLQKDGVAV